jgi:hypothetical protein
MPSPQAPNHRFVSFVIGKWNNASSPLVHFLSELLGSFQKNDCEFVAPDFYALSKQV